MVAARGRQLSNRRYRRRILGWGAAALVVTFGAGSAVSLARVEDDLRHRVDAALDESGIAGVAASFDGQTGTLRCAEPLADPQRVIDLAKRVRGVRSIGLDRRCSAATPPGSEADQEAVEPPPTATTSIPATTTPPPVPPETSITPTDGTTVLDIIIDNPQFSVLSNALRSVGLDELLAGPGPVTLFAPTDDAFAALGPNYNGALAADPDALTALLRHHIVEQNLAVSDLVAGPLTMLDGSPVEIVMGQGVQVTSGDVAAMVVDPDLDAMNGTVHTVDEVLLPADLEVGVVADVFAVVARYDEGTLTFSGTVAADAQRQRLLDAGRAQVAAENVVDELVVDAGVELSDADVDAVALLAGALPRNLVVGEVVVTVDGLFLSGVYVDDEALAAVRALAAGIGASVGLTERPVATAPGALELEQRLNGAVGAEPIRFDPGSAVLSAGAPALLDRLAWLAKSLGGITVTIEGHTDSDGAAGTNLALSTERAGAVLAALVARGVPGADLVAVGFGSSEPILVDGVEDKGASRRVEFVVATK